MTTPELAEIEGRIDRLSREEQLLLVERLVRRLGSGPSGLPTGSDDLDAMACDPEIRREVSEIEVEFAVADADGLEAE
jgi:hypothetical protein